MGLHRLTGVTLGVPDVGGAAGYYADFGLVPTGPATFATGDGGDQLRLEASPRRRLVELGVGAESPDDLSRIAARLRRLDLAVASAGDRLRVTAPGVEVDVV